MRFPDYTPPQLGPNPYQIAGQAAMQLGQQVGEFGQQQDKMRLAYEEMVQRRKDKALADQRAAEEFSLKKAADERAAAEAERKAKLDTDRAELFKELSGADIAAPQVQARIRNALASGLIDKGTYDAFQPAKPERFSAGGGYYEMGPDGQPRTIIAPKPDGAPSPQIIQTNEGVFRIDKATGQAIPVTGPEGQSLGGKKSFSPEEKAKARGSYSSSAASLARLRKEAEDIKNMRGLSFLTGGTGVLPVVPGTGPADARARLETLKSQSGFNVLQNMRDMSKTGGALGNVSNFEVQALQNNLTALDTKQSDDAFRASLDRLIEYTLDAEARLAAGYRDQYGEDAPTGAPLSPPQNPQPGSGGQGGRQEAIRVNSLEEARALPPGTVFITPDGKRKVR